MKINTLYSVGDSINLNGVYYKIVAVHVYESANVHTERYYLGNGLWFTLERQTDEVRHG